MAQGRGGAAAGRADRRGAAHDGASLRRGYLAQMNGGPMRPVVQRAVGGLGRPDACPCPPIRRRGRRGRISAPTCRRRTREAGLDAGADAAGDLCRPGCGWRSRRAIEMQIRPRSGLALEAWDHPAEHARHHRQRLSRARWGCSLINLGAEPYTIRHGDRIAQMVVAPVVQAGFAVVDGSGRDGARRRAASARPGGADAAGSGAGCGDLGHRGCDEGRRRGCGCGLMALLLAGGRGGASAAAGRPSAAAGHRRVGRRSGR